MFAGQSVGRYQFERAVKTILGSFSGPVEGPGEGSGVPRSPLFEAVSTLQGTALDAWLSMVRKGLRLEY